MEAALLYDPIFDAQEHYRLILDSMARPGKINTIPFNDIDEPTDTNNASMLIAFALLNTDVSFYTTEGENVAEFIALHTSANKANLQDADMVFVSGLHEAEFIAQLKAGTLPYPENSATIIADVTFISDTEIENALQITLSGPGVKDTSTIYVTGLNAIILDELKEQNLEFPLGVDLILTDSGNNMVCIPRSNEILYQQL